jgi:hypothetical protein
VPIEVIVRVSGIAFGGSQPTHQREGGRIFTSHYRSSWGRVAIAQHGTQGLIRRLQLEKTAGRTGLFDRLKKLPPAGELAGFNAVAPTCS